MRPKLLAPNTYFQDKLKAARTSNRIASRYIAEYGETMSAVLLETYSHTEEDDIAHNLAEKLGLYDENH